MLEGPQSLKNNNDFVLEDFHISKLSYSFILRICPADFDTQSKANSDLSPEIIEINHASFWVKGKSDAPVVEINLVKNNQPRLPLYT